MDIQLVQFREVCGCSATAEVIKQLISQHGLEGAIFKALETPDILSATVSSTQIPDHPVRRVENELQTQGTQSNSFPTPSSGTITNFTGSNNGNGHLNNFGSSYNNRKIVSRVAVDDKRVEVILEDDDDDVLAPVLMFGSGIANLDDDDEEEYREMDLNQPSRLRSQTEGGLNVQRRPAPSSVYGMDSQLQPAKRAKSSNGPIVKRSAAVTKMSASVLPSSNIVNPSSTVDSSRNQSRQRSHTGASPEAIEYAMRRMSDSQDPDTDPENPYALANRPVHFEGGQRLPSPQEIEFLEQLRIPVPADQMAPYPYNRMLGLSAISTTSPHDSNQQGYNSQGSNAKQTICPSVDNIEHWLALAKVPADPTFKRKKKEGDWMNEVLMIVDGTFAHSQEGGQVMDAIQEKSVPVTTATLPWRNTVVWRRIGREHALDGYTKPSATGANATTTTTTLPPFYEFNVELDVYVAILRGGEWLSMYENTNSPLLKQIQTANPGKTMSVLVLDLDKAPGYKSITHAAFSAQTATLQLTHNISSVTVESSANYVEIANRLCKISKALASRPYEFTKQDGPFTKFSGFGDLRHAAKGADAAWIEFLASIPNLPKDAAIAVAMVYPTLKSLMDDYHRTDLTVQAKSKLLAGIVTARNKKISQTTSTKIYEMFFPPNPAVTNPPYTPILKVRLNSSSSNSKSQPRQQSQQSRPQSQHSNLD